MIHDAFSELDDGDGDGNFEFDSLLDSTGIGRISMELDTALFFELYNDRLTDSSSSFVSVIDSVDGIRHEFRND